jgi:ferric-dicitrate binding protein FerR (iron transport regulator)
MTEDRVTERLLQLGGRRRDVPPARTARVRATVHDAWRTQVRQRRHRRVLYMTAAGLCAAGAVAAIVLTIGRSQSSTAPAAIVATIAQADGASGLRSGSVVRAGEWITTVRAGRAAMRTESGTSIRLDEHSRVRLVTPTLIEVTAGAVYIDTADGAPAMEVHTTFGSVIDIGTQFEVRLVADALRVRVRSGGVAVRRERDTIHVTAGTELTLNSRGAESRTVPAYGDAWDWTARLAPRIVLEGQTVTAFLSAIAHEHGWTVHYEDRALERDAATIVLRGTVDGLSAEAAVGVALTIADLSYTLERGDLIVSRTAMKR